MSVSQLFGQSGYSGLWEPLIEFPVSWISFLPSPPPFVNSSSFLIMRNQKNKLELWHIFQNCTEHAPPLSLQHINYRGICQTIMNEQSSLFPFDELSFHLTEIPQQMRDLFIDQIYALPISLSKWLWVVYVTMIKHAKKCSYFVSKNVCLSCVLLLFLKCFSVNVSCKSIMQLV